MKIMCRHEPNVATPLMVVSRGKEKKCDKPWVSFMKSNRVRCSIKSIPLNSKMAADADFNFPFMVSTLSKKADFYLLKWN